MNVLVDSSVWSLALRRPARRLSSTQRRVVAQLRQLIDEHRVLMIGPIRQELLSGIRDDAEFERLRERLCAFPDEPLGTADYESAASMGNRCRAAGLAAAAVDLMICAISVRAGASILTTDRDFKRYARVLPLTLLTAS